MRLYHYRSIESALLEIEKGTFHFSGRDELNDPLEGYVQAFWHGDKAAWEGLFRNYICSLMNTLLLLGRGLDRSQLHKFLFVKDIHDFDDIPIGQLFQEAGDRFWKDKRCRKIFDFYGGKEFCCDASELRLLLKFIHPIALMICMEIQIENQLISPEVAKTYYNKDFIDGLITMSIEKLCSSLDWDERKLRVRGAENSLLDQINTYGMHENDPNKKHSYADLKKLVAAMLVVEDYPLLYLQKLIELMYPSNYVVCFSKSNHNSAMWGHYADHHKGVCLIYETTCIDGDEYLLISLERIKSTAFIKVEPVTYGGEQMSSNFFETLGGLTHSQIKTWLTGSEGISKHINVFADEERRKLYWKDYRKKSFRKLDIWKYEEEYRISLSAEFVFHNDVEDRNLKYDQEFLKGIIFGIETSTDDMIRILEAIKKSQIVTKEFEFYQALYDGTAQTIQIRKKYMPFV